MTVLLRSLRLLEFILFYIVDSVISNFKVAWDILTPTDYMKPAFIELNTVGLSDRQLLALSNLISMTPGTLSLDVRDDRSALMIHCMYAGDPEALLKNLESNYVRRVRNVF